MTWPIQNLPGAALGAPRPGLHVDITTKRPLSETAWRRSTDVSYVWPRRVSPSGSDSRIVLPPSSYMKTCGRAPSVPGSAGRKR